MKQRLLWMVSLLPVLAAAAGAPAAATPQFARRYEVACHKCHVIPPKLNEFGERFVAAGYALPELPPTATWPVAVWASGRVENRELVPGDRQTIDPFANRVEFISGGKWRPWLSYFMEWRALSKETRGDGSLRDRSGRFEDAFVLVSAHEKVEFTVGQYRPMLQVDVSRRLSLSEPLVLSTSLPGEGGRDARERSLRGFSPAGRSPAFRAALNHRTDSGWLWSSLLTLPVPGELSIPLGTEAKDEASNELDLVLKGVLGEAFVRKGLASWGGHVFYDASERWLANAVATGRAISFYWTVMGGVDRLAETNRGRWSVEGEWIPGSRVAAGLRVEDRASDGAEAAFLPYATWHFPLRYTRFTLTLEQRFQEDRDATLLEGGFLF